MGDAGERRGVARHGNGRDARLLIRWHRPLYDALREKYADRHDAWRRLLIRNLRRLLDTGYHASEISVMLGVSRERVRQWLQLPGLESFRGRRGVPALVWDSARARFRPLDSTELVDVRYPVHDGQTTGSAAVAAEATTAGESVTSPAPATRARGLHPLTRRERAEKIQRIRFELGLRRGRKVTLTEFAADVSQVLRLERALSSSAALGWEQGAEPSFMVGCAIAHLGGMPAADLGFRKPPRTNMGRLAPCAGKRRR
ncbi:MAG: hypothetical protein ACYC5V_01940 [Gemmatimonadaceae bacterium]